MAAIPEDIILILGFLGLAALMLFIAGRIDRLIGSGGLSWTPQARLKRGVLLLGDTEEAQAMAGLLAQAEIGCRQFTVKPTLTAEDGYSCILALSANDQDNILLCVEARHYGEDVFTVARCNHPQFANIFAQAGVDRVLSGPCAGEEILLLIKDH